VWQGYNGPTHPTYDRYYERYAFDFVREDGRQEGQYVLAAANSTFVSWDETSGRVILAHSNNYFTIYSHLERKNDDVLQQEGISQVAQGDVIGWVGRRGIGPGEPVHLGFALVHGELDARHRNVINETPVPFTDVCDQAFPTTDSIPNEYAGITMTSCSIPQTLVGKGLDYLHRQHGANGSWSDNVGITALATLAFVNHGYGLENQDVYSATQYLLSGQDSDGRITNDPPHANYETALAILALKAISNVTPAFSYTHQIISATNWLTDTQWDESFKWGSISESDWRWGGFGYGDSQRPDLSNTQFSLLALDAAEIPKDDPMWTKAIKFVSRCQNYTTNDQSWAGTDGGFIYHPGNSLAGGTKSYGSMTGAGIWSLALSGITDLEEPRMAAALNWVENNYTWDGNPGMPDPTSMQYYYYLTLAKALTMIHKTTIGDHRWYDDLRDKLASLQKSDGYWVNTNSWAMEDNRNLVTAYTILALQTRELPPGKHLYMAVVLHSPADVHLYDPQGRHVGMNSETGQIDLEIPGAEYALTEPQTITVTPPTAGSYYVEIVPTGTGDYQLDVLGVQNNQTVSAASYTGTLTSTVVSQGSFLNVGAIEGALTIFSTPPERTPTLRVSQHSLFTRANPGTTAQVAFALQELGGEETVKDVSFLKADLRGSTGYVLPASSISITPASFDLSAGDVQTVTVQVPLIAGVPWDTYAGTVTVETGNAGARTISVVIQVPRFKVNLPLVLKGFSD
jgi:squalene-hopene/tetraprenyl-beta-curcumene cyclase